MATDDTLSYAIFTYQCGGLSWNMTGLHDSAGIGFSIGQDFFNNHELSLTPSVNDIACLNGEWNNVVYCVGGCVFCVNYNPCKNDGTCICSILHLMTTSVIVAVTILELYAKVYYLNKLFTKCNIIPTFRL